MMPRASGSPLSSAEIYPLACRRGVDYTLLSAGNIPRATTGMVTLLLFALVTFLYGVHLDRLSMEYTWIGDSWA